MKLYTKHFTHWKVEFLQSALFVKIVFRHICRCRTSAAAEFTLVIPKVERIISWLRISSCNSLSHFKLQVVDIIAFQTKPRTKNSLIFAKKLFHPKKKVDLDIRKFFSLPWKIAFFQSLISCNKVWFLLIRCSL